MGDFNGGEKPIEDCLTVKALKQMNSDRKSAERMKDSSASNDDIPCRFLTQSEKAKLAAANRRKQREEGGRTKEKSLAKSSAVARGTHINVKTNIFGGLTFCVLAGEYGLNDGDVEYAEAKELKFAKKIKKVKSKQDVERFIIQHGGKCIGEVYSPDEDLIDYYVGGSNNDLKVETMRNTIKRINRNFDQHDIKVKEKVTEGRLTKGKRQQYEHLANVIVVKWTWVFRTGEGGERNEVERSGTKWSGSERSGAEWSEAKRSEASLGKKVR